MPHQHQQVNFKPNVRGKTNGLGKPTSPNSKGLEKINA